LIAMFWTALTISSVMCSSFTSASSKNVAIGF
jgi:hypothetical protein